MLRDTVRAWRMLGCAGDALRSWRNAMPSFQICRLAQTTAATASAGFAALPPTQSLGDVIVKPGETRTISAPAGSVIDIGSLTVAGSEGLYYCLSNGNLYISGGGGVVLNVHDRLSIGTCAYISSDSPATVINVPGRGPSVRVGGEASVDIPILAPERNAIVIGANNDDQRS